MSQRQQDSGAASRQAGRRAGRQGNHAAGGSSGWQAAQSALPAGVYERREFITWTARMGCAELLKPNAW